MKKNIKKTISIAFGLAAIAATHFMPVRVAYAGLDSIESSDSVFKDFKPKPQLVVIDQGAVLSKAGIDHIDLNDKNLMRKIEDGFIQELKDQGITVDWEGKPATEQDLRDFAQAVMAPSEIGKYQHITPEGSLTDFISFATPSEDGLENAKMLASFNRFSAAYKDINFEELNIDYSVFTRENTSKAIMAHEKGHFFQKGHIPKLAHGDDEVVLVSSAQREECWSDVEAALNKPSFGYNLAKIRDLAARIVGPLEFKRSRNSYGICYGNAPAINAASDFATAVSKQDWKTVEATLRHIMPEKFEDRERILQKLNAGGIPALGEKDGERDDRNFLLSAFTEHYAKTPDIIQGYFLEYTGNRASMSKGQLQHFERHDRRVHSLKGETGSGRPVRAQIRQNPKAFTHELR